MGAVGAINVMVVIVQKEGTGKQISIIRGRWVSMMPKTLSFRGDGRMFVVMPVPVRSNVNAAFDEDK